MKFFSIFLLICCICFGILFLTDKSFPQQVHEFIYYSQCDNPIAYTIGTVDPQFNLTSDEFSADIKQATSIWSSAEGKNLFIYDPQATLHVNLMYDKRQFLNTKISQLKNQIDTNNQTLEEQISQYKTQVSDYKSRLNALNQQIDSWNQKGGAPPDVYNKLIQQQAQLKQEGDQLNQKAQSLNLSTESYNSQVENLNQTVDSFNQALAQKPEEGLYDPQNNRINIYFNVNHNELVHTLAHEFGHALGMQHVYRPQSIMYPYTTTSLTPTQQDLDDLQQACEVHPVWERFTTNFSYIINKVLTQLFHYSS